MVVLFYNNVGPVEFESRRDQILNSFPQSKKDQLLRAPSVGRHNSTRVDEGLNGRNILAMKMQVTNRTGEGGEEPITMCQWLT